LKEGSMTSTVPNKDKTQEEVFKLKLSGGQPELADVKQNPDKAHSNAVKRQSTTTGPACEIEASLKARLKEGAINSVI
jgi:hypothetical protein